MRLRRQRELSPAERALWERVMHGAEPLPDRGPASPASLEAAPEAAGASPLPRARPVPRPAPKRAAPLDPARPVDLDRRTWLRLKRGQVALEASLDLHGQTQAEAHRRLEAFITGAVGAGRRAVLVVTGKGGPGAGVLRRMVPLWLGEDRLRPHIVTYCAAQPRHGGEGALYVLLRRRRGGRA